MKKWRIVPAEFAHIAHIAADMREADIREVWAFHRRKPAEALRASLAASELAWTCFVEGSPAFMWGVARQGSLTSRTGEPWLLATPDIYRVRREFARRCRGYVDLMQARFPRLENFVHAANVHSVRWLAWCGFTVEEEPKKINGEDFLLFRREATCA